MDLKQVCCNAGDWIDLAQQRDKWENKINLENNKKVTNKTNR